MIKIRTCIFKSSHLALKTEEKLIKRRLSTCSKTCAMSYFSLFLELFNPFLFLLMKLIALKKNCVLFKLKN
jgi:hypothetical protein